MTQLPDGQPGPPILPTPRLRLRPFTPDDWRDAAVFYTDPEVCRYLYMTADPDGAAVRARLARFADAYRKGGFTLWAAERLGDGRVIGAVVLNPAAEEGEKQVSAGYCFARDCWGSGYATEALGAALAYAFETMGVRRVTARRFAENAASARVLGKAGFRCESQEEPTAGEGRGRSLYQYALTRDEWTRREGEGLDASSG
ncbi:MAG: GNAT family N-acetyltransferase [Oscillospiraceae bacterium]|jgi:RimJ/RimL family protein N-acetyltransferase|nr:GNAT family N-acetyltransferase [Oscillospiraceae bacterium]